MQAQLSATKQADSVHDNQTTAAFLQSPVGMAILDPQGKFLNSNAAFQRMVGYSGLELVDIVLAQLVHADDSAAHNDLFIQLIKGSRANFQTTRRYHRKSGQVGWFHSALSAVCDESGQLAFITLTDEDISAQRKTEDALQAIAEGTFSASGPDFFRALVGHLATALDVPFAMVTECTTPAKDHVRSL